LAEGSGKIAKNTEARQKRIEKLDENYLSIASKEVQASYFSGLWFSPSCIANLAWLRGGGDAPFVFDRMTSVLLVSRSKAWLSFSCGGV
jgi:hypothetical protein